MFTDVKENMKLIKPNRTHIGAMMAWFYDEGSLKTWAGPNFRYPFDIDSFTTDLKLIDLASFSLLDGQGTFVGFGQYYLRHGKCHLGRLVVSPDVRGKGIGQILLAKLISHGTTSLGVDDSSLFVLDHNQKAIKSYQRFGFSFSDYPELLPIERCLYMTKKAIE